MNSTTINRSSDVGNKLFHVRISSSVSKSTVKFVMKYYVSKNDIMTKLTYVYYGKLNSLDVRRTTMNVNDYEIMKEFYGGK